MLHLRASLASFSLLFVSATAFMSSVHRAPLSQWTTKIFVENDYGYRKKSNFDEDILIRPGAEDWMFDEDGRLAEDQVKFDWKSVEYRDDQLGGCKPDMSMGTVDPNELKRIEHMLEVFGNTLEVLEADNGVFRFKYWGLVKNQSGMESWGRQLIMDHHPKPETVKSVAFLTPRKRDTIFGDKV